MTSITLSHVIWNDSSRSDDLDLVESVYPNLGVDIHCRKTIPADIPQICALATEETVELFPSCDPGKLYETSTFSLVLLDYLNEKILAHASFSDTPHDPLISVDGKLWKTHLDLRWLNPVNTLFLSYFVCNLDHSPKDFFPQILEATFLSCSFVENILLVLPASYSESQEISLSVPNCKILQLTVRDRTERKLVLYSKDEIYPPLRIREGREHDLDDLSPLLKLNTEDLQQYFNKQYLNEVIAMSDRTSQSIVAEHKSVAVGMITVTAEINYRMLNDFYQLEPFNGLYKPHLSDKVARGNKETGREGLVCTEDDYKYVKDDFDQFCIQSGATSPLETSSASTSITSVCSTGTSCTHEGIQDSEEPSETFRQHSKAKPSESLPRESAELPAPMQNSLAGAADTIIPTVPSGDQVQRHPPPAMTTGDGSSSGGDHELKKFSSEILAMYKRVRDADLDIRTLSDVSDQMREQLIELDSLFKYQEFSESMQVSSSPITSGVCRKASGVENTKSEYYGIPNALAIHLCVLDDKHRIRLLDLIQGAFFSYPNREYCVVTIPYGTPIPYWMQLFVRVVPRRRCIFGEELYVIHRNIFNCRMRVRRATEQDTQKVAKLVETLIAKNNILNDFCRANSFACAENNAGLHAFVVLAGPTQQTHIVGLIIISDDVCRKGYKIGYDLDSYIYNDLHSESDYGYVHHFVLLPCFRKMAKLLLKEVMRHLKKNVLLHSLYSPYRESVKMNHQSFLNNLDDWILIPPRPKMDYSKLGLASRDDTAKLPPPEALDSSESFALMMHSKKFTYDPKADVTARIVFVGASETAFYCLEKLLGHQTLNFVHLTLISPHGVPGSMKPDYIRSLLFPRKGGPALSEESDDQWYDRIGIYVKVSLIYGQVTSVLREEKLLVINNHEIVPYDTLVLTVGQQFVRPDCDVPEVEDVHMTKFHEKSAILNTENNIAQPAKKVLRRNTRKPKNVFVVNTEHDAAEALHYIRSEIGNNVADRLIIHGACIPAYCCLNALLKMGVSPERIVFVVEFTENMPWEESQPYRDTPMLRKAMAGVMEELRIKVLPHHKFKDWALDLKENLVTQVQFVSTATKYYYGHDVYPCFAYFAFSQYRISDEFLSMLLEAYLAVDDGVLVNLDLKTNDNSIFAAGPCSAYTKKLLAKKYNHVFYNSAEIGYELADSLIKTHDSTRRANIARRAGPQQPQIPTRRVEPYVVYAELPTGWYYFYCREAGPLENCCGGNCVKEEHIKISTGSVDPEVDPLQRYFSLEFNSSLNIQRIECISKERFSPWNIRRLYGAHNSLLNNVLERFEGGEITCLYKYFMQPWLSAIYLDRWSSFKAELSEVYGKFSLNEDLTLLDLLRAYILNVDNPETFTTDGNILRRVIDSSGLKREIETKFLEFLQYHKHELPMYARPDLAKAFTKERVLSSLMYPSGKICRRPEVNQSSEN